MTYVLRYPYHMMTMMSPRKRHVFFAVFVFAEAGAA